MIYYWLTYSRAPVNVVDLTPSAGKRSSLYLENRFVTILAYLNQAEGVFRMLSAVLL